MIAAREKEAMVPKRMMMIKRMRMRMMMMMMMMRVMRTTEYFPCCQYTTFRLPCFGNGFV